MWGALQVKYAAKEAMIKYLSTQWVNDDWKDLWTSAYRDDIAHFLIETSNAAEGFFNVSKNDILHDRYNSDIMVYLAALVGTPSNPDSVFTSYLYSLVLELQQMLSGVTNMRLPRRKRADRMRDAVYEIVGAHGGEGSVQDVPGFEGLFYHVASAAVRDDLMHARQPRLEDFYLVDILRNKCPCKHQVSHCKHVHAARTAHVFRYRRRPTWHDAETSLYWAYYFSADTASKALSLVTEAVGVEPPPSVSVRDINTSILTAATILAAATSDASSALSIARSHIGSMSSLSMSATASEKKAAMSTLQKVAALTKSLKALTVTSESVTRTNSTRQNGLSPRPRAARSAAEVDAHAARLATLSVSINRTGIVGGGASFSAPPSLLSLENTLLRAHDAVSDAAATKRARLNDSGGTDSAAALTREVARLQKLLQQRDRAIAGMREHAARTDKEHALALEQSAQRGSEKRWLGISIGYAQALRDVARGHPTSAQSGGVRRAMLNSADAMQTSADYEYCDSYGDDGDDDDHDDAALDDGCSTGDDFDDDNHVDDRMIGDVDSDVNNEHDSSIFVGDNDRSAPDRAPSTSHTRGRTGATDASFAISAGSTGAAPAARSDGRSYGGPSAPMVSAGGNASTGPPSMLVDGVRVALTLQSFFRGARPPPP